MHMEFGDFYKMNRKRVSPKEADYNNGFYYAVMGVPFNELEVLADNSDFLLGYKAGLLEYNDYIKKNDDYMSDIQSVAIKVR